MECKCCYGGLNKMIVVTLWGVFCSQECADEERYWTERSEDRDYEIGLGE